ncbi:MAG: hypothetical protein GDA43_10205 [Hormoscilla sp. SP5CHS1]|nr:hypothetical protein [Hormoscilla sp. SP12CHS1]MBC6453534.1 hypothetical protein [Hormoscilla sp. SP5CHS1]
MSTYNTAEEIVTAIRSLLLEGDFYAAQKLSFEAQAQYPEHEVVKKLAYLLAPSVVTVDRDPPMTDVRENRNWLKQNRMEYRGRWVALKDGHFLADGKNIDELVEQVGKIKVTGIFVTAIY